MKKNGFTLIELITLMVILVMILGVFALLLIGMKGCNEVVDHVKTSKTVQAGRMESNPPQYAVGDIVYHKANDKKMIVARNNIKWNNVKNGWDIKVKDGGNMDIVGGFLINENEVTSKAP